MIYPEIINNPEFEEIATVNHNDLKQFLIKEVEQQPVWARVANMFQITGLMAFMLGGFKAFIPFLMQKNAAFLLWMLYGLIFTFTLLIVLHELLHAVAYYYVGARKLSFGVVWRKFMFYVTADKFVADRKKFTIVALAPAVIVSVLCIIGMAVFYQQPAFYFFVPVFGLHFIFCGGDFSLLCFFENRKNLEIYTFDLKEEGKTYFYQKVPRNLPKSEA
jgi:hypothetical protein